RGATVSISTQRECYWRPAAQAPARQSRPAGHQGRDFDPRDGQTRARPGLGGPARDPRRQMGAQRRYPWRKDAPLDRPRHRCRRLHDAWDTAHGVIAVMGDRFVVVRADSNSVASRLSAAGKAIENTGQEAKMRAELADIAGKLVTSASTAE